MNKRWLWVRITGSLVLLVICLHLIDFRDVATAVTALSPSLFLLAFVLNSLGTVVVRAWIAYLTTGPTGIRLQFLALLRINFVARFYTLLLPRGAAAAVRWHHYREGGSSQAASALLMFETLVSMMTLLASAALLLSFEESQRGPLARAILPLTWVGLVGVGACLVPFLHSGSANLLDRTLKRLLPAEGRIPHFVGKLMATVRAYPTLHPRRVLAIFLAGVAGYVLFVASAWVLLKGMGIPLDLATVAWIRSVTLLLALIPITVAGLGLREASFIALLGEYGVTSSEAFTFSMATFAIQLMLGAIGGVMVFWRWLRNPGTTSGPST